MGFKDLLILIGIITNGLAIYTMYNQQKLLKEFMSVNRTQEQIIRNFIESQKGE